MLVVQSLNSIVPIERSYTENIGKSLRMYDSYAYAYEYLYRTQPNVRTCVDFLARNMAQIGIHIYQRKAETDRIRIVNDPLADLLKYPNPFTTQYRMIESWMGDLGIWFNAFMIKIRREGQLVLLRVPPQLVRVSGGLVPTLYEVGVPSADPMRLPPDQVIHLRGYNPDSSVIGLTPLETLRRILAEEHSMGDYREGFWQNAARMSGVIERPPEAPEWSKDARARFKEEFEALYSGSGGSGKTAILEEGMKWKESSFSPEQAEYLNSRKLTREECARAYHIPLPMVGILDNATFSNIREQHRNLYQDCLGPWMQMLSQDLELQLSPDFPELKGEVYLEFNIEEKLRGSFEEQATGLQASVGQPWMTPNEARGRVNLPAIEGGDELAKQANAPGSSFEGGSEPPPEKAPDEENPPPEKAPGKSVQFKARGLDPTLPNLRKKHIAKWEKVLQHHFERQKAAILPRVPKKAASLSIEDVWKDPGRWNSELAADLFQLNKATAGVWAKWMAERLGKQVDTDRMEEYLQEISTYGAEGINADIRLSVEKALEDPDPNKRIGEIFDSAIALGAGAIALGAVTSASSFGAHEGAKQSGVKLKTWQVNSGNPRPAHAKMNGETVKISENFSSGQRWPGDPEGGPENTAGCECSVIFGEVEW